MTKVKTKRAVVRALAIVLAVLMPLLTTVIAFAEQGTGAGAVTFGQKKYENPDINALTGHGEEPEELSVSAGAKYQERQWYEYIQYSDKAIASYRETETSRLLFYDPYTYTDSLIMQIEDDPATSEFSTMSSYTVSYTNSKTITSGLSSTYTTTTATQTSGRDVTHTDVTNSGSTKTVYNHSTKSTDRGEIIGENRITHELFESDTELGTKDGLIGIIATETIKIGIDTTQQHMHTTYKDHGTDTEYTGEDTVENNTSSTTDGWTELSARVTATTGSTFSNNESWSETETTTVTKTFAATHFASDGITPLGWKIVHYSVLMPMKCCLQVKMSGEWVTISTVYCMLTTIRGTCRAWEQNGQVYYEDWSNGEPVVMQDFWGRFMNKDELLNAYKTEPKLYPTGGER